MFINETDEDLDNLFELGIMLEFSNGEIPAMPGFFMTRYSDEVYKTEKQNFKFTIKTQDRMDLDLQVGDSFAVEYDVTRTNYVVSSDFIEDANLTYFFADFVSRENV